jgi:hypothetical protein
MGATAALSRASTTSLAQSVGTTIDADEIALLFQSWLILGSGVVRWL